jgi:hypothetical protein
MMKALQQLSVILLVGFCAEAHGQISFQKKYGALGTGDNGQSVVQASDSGYYIAGVRVSGTSTFIGEGLLKRTDKYGNELWTKYLSTPGSSDLTFDWIEKTSDGNLVVTGIVNYGVVNGNSDYDVYLAKLDTSGAVLWHKNYGGEYRQRGYRVMETFDGGFIVGGWNEITGTAITSFYLVRTSSTGDTVWTKSYSNGMQQYGLSVAQTADSGFVICGSIQQPTQIGTHSYVVRTNADGDTIWTKILSGLGQGAAYDVRAASGNHVLIAGYTVASCSQPYLCELDENGAIVWKHSYSDGPCGWAQSVTRTNDYGYAVFGMDNSSDYYLIKTDSTGNQQWFKKFHESNSDYGYCVRQTLDGGYIMTGTTAMGASDIDISLIKTGIEGELMTSVDKLDGNSPMTAYPNPAEGFVSLAVAEKFRSVPLTIRIYNTLGQHMLLEDNYRSSKRIDLSNLPAGMYHIIVSFGEQIVANESFIRR